MTTGFSTAANWLKDISGSDPSDQLSKKDDAHDPIIRDLRAMKDEETKHAVRVPPRLDSHGGRDAAAQTRNPHIQVQQPKPKFVAHKDPTKSKKGKGKVSSNRLGGDDMA
mmetsp:Transcript_30883/g.65277  ORF Transcript_30883/g.65277 Transcript_30883/m.65277 type:complete len:110 (-) Transcript_30883:249-578(-)|eukprot:CAMPEP_0172308206 /NCGR_PEP_ID=MMETSP1058-20130122/8877_1 /TAXON_ID=83371 /ORGANISM="Detonula confervacea, Strain CCMP 353" /LENGTH=109 /DNA_ID=CAMNT_0013020573 /DNA_START=206 /DNA_END=535 /DNA_ORIENTATION=+